MCGIAGLVALRGRPISEPEKRAAARIRDMLEHRGPDGFGVQCHGDSILVHRRLAIQDRNRRSGQPICDGSGRFAVTFGGEIYNFRDLRSELQRRGHSFRTDGDAEVVVEAFACWGVQALDRLRGMYAVAVHDAASRTTILARDPFGKKPLHFHLAHDRLYFASEVSALLNWPDVPRAPNHDALAFYLSFGYCPVQHAAFADVARVRPGHYLTVGSEREAREVCYWSPPDVDPSLDGENRDAIVSELQERIDAAVLARMPADVPVGAFLSGGVDSAVVVSALSSHAPGPVRTFTVAFQEPGYDETDDAEQSAAALGCDHRTVLAGPDVAAALPVLLWQVGEPFADPSLLATHRLAREARRTVGVCLTGDGGDEVFLGYDRYFRFAEVLQQFRAGAIQSGWAAGAFYDTALFARDLYRHLIGVFSEQERLEMCGPDLAHTLVLDPADQLGDAFEATDLPIDTSSRTDIVTYLPGDILVKLDTATMACALEARSPLLDIDLAGWVLSLPESVRLASRGGLPRGKGLLREALASRMSGAAGRRKHGFSVPLDHWLRTTLASTMREVLDPVTVQRRGLLNARWVENLVERHLSGERNSGHKLYALICLEIWCRSFLDRVPDRAMDPLRINLDELEGAPSEVARWT